MIRQILPFQRRRLKIALIGELSGCFQKIPKAFSPHMARCQLSANSDMGGQPIGRTSLDPTISIRKHTQHYLIATVGTVSRQIRVIFSRGKDQYTVPV